MWLECVGVVSGCCCKEVYRLPHNITYIPTPFVLALFFCSSIPYFFVHFVNVFYILYSRVYIAVLLFFFAAHAQRGLQ